MEDGCYSYEETEDCNLQEQGGDYEDLACVP